MIKQNPCFIERGRYSKITTELSVNYQMFKRYSRDGYVLPNSSTTKLIFIETISPSIKVYVTVKPFTTIVLVIKKADLLCKSVDEFLYDVNIGCK